MLLRNYLFQFDYNLTYLHFGKNNVFWGELSPGTVVLVKYLDIATEKVDVKTFIGVCLRQRARVTRSSVLLRNTFLQVAIEQIFFYNSPILLGVKALTKYKKKFRLCKLYFMRASLGISYKL